MVVQPPSMVIIEREAGFASSANEHELVEVARYYALGTIAACELWKHSGPLVIANNDDAATG